MLKITRDTDSIEGFNGAVIVKYGPRRFFANAPRELELTLRPVFALGPCAAQEQVSDCFE